MALFDPFKVRDVELKNRIVVSPMSQYISVEGAANDWHLVHLGRFALGGAGLVSPRRRRSRRVGVVPTVTWAFGVIARLSRLRVWCTSSSPKVPR